MINFKSLFISALLALGCICANASSNFTPSYKKKTTTEAVSSNIYWTDANGKVAYNVNANPSTVVKIALGMFANDMKSVTGCSTQQKSNAAIQIYQLDQLSNKEFSALEKLSTPIHQFIASQDSYWIGTRKGKVIVVGSDARGTAYGILELSRMAGVSPWKDYYGVQPQQRKFLSTKVGYESLQIPSIGYRGLLINNSAWMNRKNYSNLCRLMLRLKANVLWQGDSKHEIAYHKEVTDSFNITISEAGKVVETTGKKHKKHKKTIEDVKMLWTDAQLSFTSMSPSLILGELTSLQPTAHHKGKGHKSHNNSNKAWIANVLNPQAATYKLSLFMDLAWNTHAVTANQLPNHLASWLTLQFGSGLGKKLLPIIEEYYRLTNIRPTEYMAMPYGDWEFHSGEFGNELERYLYDYDKLKAKVADIERSLPAYQQTAFLQTIKIPIYTAALTAEKELEAQEARHIARPGLFAKDAEAKAAAALSLSAYQKLKSLYPSAQPPVLPGTLTSSEIKSCLKDAFDRNEDLKPLSYSMIKDVIAKNACQWTSTTQAYSDKRDSDAEVITSLPYLGHSMKSVWLPQGASLKYVVYSDMEGDARFTLAAIPDYINKKGDMQVSVSIDQKAPVVISLKDAYNHSSWKMDVWRGQTRKSFFTTLSRGNHTIEIKALDDHIILDQWILDFDVDREYYMIPVK